MKDQMDMARLQKRSGGERGQKPSAPPFFRRFPAYVWPCLTAAFAVQLLVFYATRVFLPYLTLHDMSLPLDGRIPFVPQWVTVYFLAFASWLVSAVWILSESKLHGYRFTCGYLLALLISAVIFLACPATMARPELEGSGFFMDWMRFLYRVDSPTNLCPSLHVLISYFCWRGAIGCQKIPRWYQWFNFAFLILVCCSTLLVKQHVVVDIPAAVIVGEAAMQLTRLWRLERIPLAIERFFGNKKACK